MANQKYSQVPNVLRSIMHFELNAHCFFCVILCCLLSTRFFVHLLVRSLICPPIHPYIYPSYFSLILVGERTGRLPIVTTIITIFFIANPAEDGVSSPLHGRIRQREPRGLGTATGKPPNLCGVVQHEVWWSGSANVTFAIYE